VYFNNKLVVYGGWTGLETTDELNAIDTKTGELYNFMYFTCMPEIMMYRRGP